MGLLVSGQWVDRWYDTESNAGAFKRQQSQFRNWITADGSAGPSGENGFKAEPDRYHLYVSLACPWAHRTLIFRAIKGLEKIVSVSVVHPYMGDQGWSFKRTAGSDGDSVNNLDFLHQIYTLCDPQYSGRVTVPVLWDKQQRRIVSNESAEIIRMFNTAFDELGATPGDYYPEALSEEIDELNSLIYDRLNNGVYKAGFATSQEVYQQEVEQLFVAMEYLELRLANQRYLVGSHLTEADWRLFTTLIRFDSVYHGHFKCNLKQLKDYPNLWAYTRELYQKPGISNTVNLRQIKAHYYGSHLTINPTGVIPAGPILDIGQPHGRELLG
ncbi:MAG: glutathione S-transferase family protein [Motiliproteus sp.]|nr:glutathione S-transferase family protein [Motiliproteus sp.]MCW9054216.1 glutathione S-transferase family protein [Motiliproteus sp.]